MSIFRYNSRKTWFVLIDIFQAFWFINHCFISERTIIVSQYCGKPLSNYIGKDALELKQILKIAQQILLGLHELHKQNIVHRNLSSDNVLMQADDYNLKMFDYGLYHMTGEGSLVSFPIM